ncbi:MAG: 50S ribosomal protein L11 methyltransferase [Pseudomonadales bacterium]|nr:50S ribosomal protein L11 methyltransferase [Pseudomonadales bacterium]
MAWLNITLTLPRREADYCSELLAQQGALAVSSEDAGDTPVLEPLPGTSPLWDRVSVCGLFALDADLEQLSAILSRELDSQFDLHVQFLEAQDWSETWRLHVNSYRFAGKLWVVPTDWQANNSEQRAYNGAVLRLDPGLAFGTGSHATTHMCLSWLANAELDGATVVDYGCGSGILAIAAILLGAEKVFAIDYDEQALVSTTNNAQVNSVSENQIVVLTVDNVQQQLLDQSLPPVDVVIANILMNPLLELSDRLTQMILSGGRLVLSGILETQIESIIQAYTDFSFGPAVLEDGWACIAGVKSDG